MRHLHSVPALLLFAACGGGGSTTTPSSTPATIAVHAGNNQQAPSGAAVATAPAVIVKDSDGDPVSNVSVGFAVTSGGGNISGATPKTGADGVARVTSWTLGSSGTQRITATVTGLPPVTFDATITPGTTVVTKTISGSGGTIEITEDGNPYEGLVLTVPSGTFTTTSEWMMQVDPARTLPSLPAGVTQHGPALLISTGTQSRGSKMMTLTVPMQATAGKRRMIVFHDALRGITEVLPTVASTATTITVMTSHLDPSLLVGSATSGALFPASFLTSASGKLGGGGVLFPIETIIAPLLEVPQVNSPQERWFMPDLPTPAFPNGHGPGIPVMNTMVKTLGGTMSHILRGITPAGFIADTLTYGTLELISGKLITALGPSFNEYVTAMSGVPKPERDAVVASQISTDMAFSKAPLPVALMQGLTLGAPKAYGSAVATSGFSVIVSEAADAASRTVSIPQATGMDAIIVKQHALGLEITASAILALPSFVVPYETITPDVQRMISGMSGSDAIRGIANTAVAAAANLPSGGLEYRANVDAPWEPVTGFPLMIRSVGGAVRAIASNVAATLVVADPTTGVETGRTIGESVGLEVALLPGFATAPASAPKGFLGAALRTVGSTLQQLLPFSLTYIKAPFVITPPEIEITQANRKVDFTASVPNPPAAGYRIKWDWGDGTTPTENLSINTATHTYTTVDKYHVIATLMANTTARTVLGVDTSEVTTPAGSPFWKLTSMTDVDFLFDPDLEAGGFIFDMLVRAVNEPASGLIGIDPSGATSELFFRVKRSSTWTTCCPPNYSGNDYRVLLGVTPTLVKTFGPVFSVWNSTTWSQSSGDITTGTMNGKYPFGSLPYPLSTGGTQTGPEVGIAITSTRSGNTLTGTITFTIWFVGQSGELELPGDEDPYRFSFTAVRMQ